MRPVAFELHFEYAYALKNVLDIPSSFVVINKNSKY